MKQSPGLEKTTQLIAENVVSAFEQGRDGAGFHPYGRQMAVAAIVGDLLAVMPTMSSPVLAAACDVYLDRLADMRLPGPRVEAVDLGEGSVTMRCDLRKW